MNNKRNHSSYIHAMAIASWVLAYLLTGRLVWHWISPESIGAIIVFVPIWLVLGYIAQTALFLTVTLAAKAIIRVPNDVDASKPGEP
jgi:hypothetical protein